MSISTKSYLRTGLMLIGFGLLPIAVSLAAGLIAAVLGCTLDEGSVHACVVLGLDIGPALYALGLAVWFVAFTLPPALIGVAILFVLWVISLRRGETDMDETDANA
jgi:hypothetical protein